MVQDVAQRFVHSLDKGRVTHGPAAFRAVTQVLPLESFVNLKRIVNGVMRHIQEEWLPFLNGTVNLVNRLESQGLGEEGVRPVVFGEARNMSL